ERPERDGGVGTEDDPKRYLEGARRGTPRRSDRRDDEDECDDPHPFLSVVRPVRHAVEEARDELKALELMVHFRRGVSAEQANDNQREAECEEEPDERRGDHIDDDLDEPLQEDFSEDDRGEESCEETGQDERPERRPVPPDDEVIRKERCGAEDERHPRHEEEKEHVRGAGEENRPRSCSEGGRADEATDQRMTARGRKAPKPRD